MEHRVGRGRPAPAGKKSLRGSTVTGHDTLKGSGKLLNQAIEMGREAAAVTLVGQVNCKAPEGPEGVRVTAKENDQRPPCQPVPDQPNQDSQRV